MIVPAVSDESRAGGTHGQEPAARRFTLDRKHAAARGVLRSRVRQSAASRESSWTAGTPPSRRAARPITAIGAAGRVACHPWMRRWMRRSRRSVTSRCTTNCTRSPARHLPGRRAGGPVFAVFPGPLRNGVTLVLWCCWRPPRSDGYDQLVILISFRRPLTVLTNTERQARYRERRKAGESRYRRASGPENRE